MQRAADEATQAGRAPADGGSWWVVRVAFDRVCERLLWAVKDELLGLVRAKLPSVRPSGARHA
eukprot:1160879-Prymnesium_polylepis.1